MKLPDTQDATRDSTRLDAAPKPGLILVFSGTTPEFRPFALTGAPFLVGREGPAGALSVDDRLSRRHAEITRTPSAWIVRDLGSRNGTFVDGVAVHGEVSVVSPRVFRAGDTLFVPCDDTGSAYPPSDEGGALVGSKLRRAFAEVDLAASGSETLLILGESGTGKELAARRFHERGPNRAGPFVAVNCAAIPEGLAERLLFGAKRGAYSGATIDAIGHLQAADSGVLFLDEGGELDLLVQAKLLRVLETREVLPLGASQGLKINTRICVATHRDLRGAVAEGKLRGDLYHRIAPPEVVLPALRERLDEITQHVLSAVRGVSPKLLVQAKLIEACLLRDWPGNVRELRKHLHNAALRAESDGSDRVRLEHLSQTAGKPITLPPAPPAASDGALSAPAPREPRRYVKWSTSMTRETLERTLEEHAWSASSAARSLGMGRSQFYREMARFGIRLPRAKVD